MPRPIGTFLHVKRVKRADGTIREYYSNRKTGQSLGTDRASAEARIHEWLNAQVPSQAFGKATLDALIADYLRTTDFRQLAPRTQQLYRTYLEQLRARFAAMPVELITPPWIERLKLNLQDQPGRCNHTLQVLKIILQWGVRLGYCKSNAAREVSRISQPPRATLWTAQECDAFLAAASGAQRLAFALMLYTAQRLSDVLAMTRGQVSEHGGRLFIALRQGKTGELLDVPVHAKLEPMLRERLADASGGLLLIPSPRGRPWMKRNFSRDWDKATRLAGLSGLQRRPSAGRLDGDYGDRALSD